METGREALRFRMSIRTGLSKGWEGGEQEKCPGTTKTYASSGQAAAKSVVLLGRGRGNGCAPVAK